MRLLKFLLGLVIIAGSGFMMLGSSYALMEAINEGSRGVILYPVLFLGGSVIGMLIGLRVFLRAIFPSFTFTRLLLVAAIVIACLHFGGYVLPSSNSLKAAAEKIQAKIQSIGTKLNTLTKPRE